MSTICISNVRDSSLALVRMRNSELRKIDPKVCFESARVSLSMRASM